jgi:hypothetical protein
LQIHVGRIIDEKAKVGHLRSEKGQSRDLKSQPWTYERARQHSKRIRKENARG